MKEEIRWSLPSLGGNRGVQDLDKHRKWPWDKFYKTYKYVSRTSRVGVLRVLSSVHNGTFPEGHWAGEDVGNSHRKQGRQRDIWEFSFLAFSISELVFFWGGDHLLH